MLEHGSRRPLAVRGAWALRWIGVAAALVGVAGCAQGGKTDDASVGLDAEITSECTSDPDCDDGVACTTDACDPAALTCASVPDDAACEASEMCDLERGCVLRPPCLSDDDCDDGAFCNGLETCDPATGCQRGTEPSCDDGRGCTDDSCDADANACANTPNDALCSNGIVCDGVEGCAPDDELADANGCITTAPPVCDDSVDCTLDSCTEAAGGCEHVPDASACADGVFCNGDETCDASAGCVPGVAPGCDDSIDCTTDGCDASLDACAHAPVDASCSDEAGCNGEERCDEALGCVAGTAVSCSDGLACTTDRCLEPTLACEHLGSDADGDGYEAVGCGAGDDCDDLAGAVHPGVTEVCDGIDNDCSGGADDGAGMQCRQGSSPAACSTGCGTAGTRACTSACTYAACVAAAETCNDCDDNGNGVVDEGFVCRLGTSATCVTACGTAGSQSCAADCGGYGACQAAGETCNGCDDNGDGSVDEGFACRRGTTEPCTTACGTTGTRTCALDCSGFGACVATEVCNGCDDDGDGVSDDGFTCRQSSTASCTTACGTAGSQQCNASCSGFGVCAAAAEVCDNACDDDGDSMVDEGCGAPNDLCTGAYVLAGATGTRTDPYSNASRSVSDCGAGGELWYRVVLTSRKVLYLDTFDSTFDTRVSMRTSCGGASVQCEDDDCGTAQEQWVRVLDAGTYYFAVHAFSAATTTGTIQLRWQTISAGNGAYTRVTANGTHTGTTAGTGTLSSSCGGGGPENGHFFTLCPGATRTVGASTCSTTAWDTVLSLRAAGDVQVTCNDDACSTQSTMSGAASGPGLYVLQVDGFGSSAGAYSVAVTGL